MQRRMIKIKLQAILKKRIDNITNRNSTCDIKGVRNNPKNVKKSRNVWETTKLILVIGMPEPVKY